MELAAYYHRCFLGETHKLFLQQKWYASAMSNGPTVEGDQLNVEILSEVMIVLKQIRGLGFKVKSKSFSCGIFSDITNLRFRKNYVLSWEA